MSIAEDAKAARQSQLTFETYITGLAFTVLGFAVQTAKFSCPLPDALELLSWLFLFGAGLAGLFRLQSMPEILGMFAWESSHEEVVGNLKGILAVAKLPTDWQSTAEETLEARGQK